MDGGYCTSLHGCDNAASDYADPSFIFMSRHAAGEEPGNRHNNKPAKST